MLTSLFHKYYETMTDCYFEQYQNLLKDDKSKIQRSFVIPDRRQPCISGIDTIHIEESSQSDKFLDDADIIEVHAMRFRHNSPFLKPLTDDFIEYLKTEETFVTNKGIVNRDTMWKAIIDDMMNKDLHAIGITKDNRHVVLQRGARMGVNACIFMLLLDHKIPINVDLNVLSYGHVKPLKKCLTAAGFQVNTMSLNRNQDNLKILVDAVKTHGALLFELSVPELFSSSRLLHTHCIILDAIDEEKSIIRDPFHGWSVTIKTSFLLSRIDDYSQITHVRKS